MERHLAGGLLAAAAALAALGVTAAGAAAAAAPARPAARAQGLAPPVFTADRAGYRAGFGTSWRFRWVASTFTVPDCASQPASHGWTDNGVALGPNGQTGARLKVECADHGTGAGVDYQLTAGGTPGREVPVPIRLPAGHSVTTGIYYDQAQGLLRFTVTDDTTGNSRVRAVGVGTGLDYFGAGIGSFFDPRAVTPPPADVRTGAFSSTHLTAYDMTRGSMLGPWPASQLAATITGTAGGDVIANAPALWNGGENFGVWERTSAHR